MLQTEYGCVTRLRDGSFFESMDLHLANCLCNLANKDLPDLALAAALTSRATGMGHVCLDLEHPFSSTFPEASAEFPDRERLREALAGMPGVGGPGDFEPLILDGTRLYLARYHRYERELAQALTGMAAGALQVDSGKLAAILGRLFPGSDASGPDMQKVAAFAAARRRLTVITGGPGTGKTTTVARIVALLAELEDIPPSRIGLAAPTGKAAARLSESLASAFAGISLPESLVAHGPLKAATLHRLLGMKPGAAVPRHGAEDPLAYTVLIVDEASMVDLPLMAKLVRAMPEDGRLILLGDRDQLASVEAGAVLSDICKEEYQHGFSPGFISDFAQVDASATRLSSIRDGASPLADSVVALTKTWRFKDTSGIAAISSALRDGDAARTASVLRSTHEDLFWRKLGSAEGLEDALAPVLEHAAKALVACDPGEAFAAWAAFQLLTPLRKGPYGVESLNALIERRLRERGAITGRGWWYPGKPVMVRRNDPALKLFNGDIGVTLPEQDGSLKVHFRADGGYRSFPPARLQDVEEVYAMTVHKSQGSEFEAVMLLLPDQDSPILTRELLYTAITRAKREAVVVLSGDVFLKSIERRVVRHSGLGGRLWVR
ncbi:exodeoxyribonuclease V subunit alpha [Fundidesulfovibrio soli]|uniref:exodeoxyribonuclease V subunit alpha n=1 Tax=Fundidesulfovibrio soli TaxID=2922716 RepID=UPI001FAEE71C|nr:exodeoxyribonuclease V subunit alpha [Fundidesulfovibrio soli]